MFDGVKNSNNLKKPPSAEFDFVQCFILQLVCYPQNVQNWLLSFISFIQKKHKQQSSEDKTTSCSARRNDWNTPRTKRKTISLRRCCTLKLCFSSYSLPPQYSPSLAKTSSLSPCTKIRWNWYSKFDDRESIGWEDINFCHFLLQIHFHQVPQSTAASNVAGKHSQ